MIDNQEFMLEGEARDSGHHPAQEPKVVIEYRRGGIPPAILAPLLVLLAALAILTYRKETPIRRFRPVRIVVEEPSKPRNDLSSAPADTSPAPEARPEVAPGLSSPPASGNETTSIGTALAPDLPVANAAASEPASTLSPPTLTDPGEHQVQKSASGSVEGEPGLAVAQRSSNPPALAANLTPDPVVVETPPKISREEALEDIQREAAIRKAESLQFEALRPLAQSFELAETFRKAQEGRIPFHTALRQTLLTRRPDMGRRIESLCLEFGRSADPKIQKHFNRLMRTSFTRLSRRTKVELMREWGFSEPMILDYLANDIDRLMGTRGGPRSPSDVLVWAARALLSMPPSKSSGPTAARSAPGVDPRQSVSPPRPSR